MMKKESSYQKLKRERDEWKQSCYNLVLRPNQAPAITIAVQIELDQAIDESVWRGYFNGENENPQTFVGFAEFFK